MIACVIYDTAIWEEFGYFGMHGCLEASGAGGKDLRRPGILAGFLLLIYITCPN